MSIQPPQGILTIPNATLRVGELQVDSTRGLDTVLNNIERNTIVLEDSEVYEASTQWGLKVPNIFVATFEIKGAGSSFNFRNTSNSDAMIGYTLTFSGTTLTLKYNDGSLTTSLTTATIPNLDATYGKVYLTYEKQYFTVTVDGTRVLTYKDTETRTPPEGEYTNFFAGTGSPGFKNLKVVAGHLISDGANNVSLYGGLAVTSNLEVGQANLFVDTVSGNVGVGTDTPKEALDVVGNMHLTRVSNVSQVSVDSNVVTEYTGPHDRPLRKYPEVALTSSAINSDYKGYTIQRSSDYTDIYGTVEKLFNNAEGSDVNSWVAGWNGTNGTYDVGTGEHSGTYHTPGSNNVEGTGAALFAGAPDGEWVSLQIPNGIRLDHVKIRARDHTDGVEQYPKDFEFWGSNNGTDWSLIKSFTNQSWPGQNNKGSYHVNSNILYNRIAMIITKIPPNVQYGTHCVFGQLEYYGYEEGSGSLDTTLKSVYNVPATTGTQLEVYYDAKDLTAMPSTVTDLSPNSNDGSPTDVSVSDGAFVFDGSGDAIVSSGTSTSLDGNATFSISLWSKTNAVSSGSNALFMLGYWSTNKSSGLRIDASTGKYRFFTTNGVSKTSPTTALLNEWTHITLIHEGTSGYKFYVNGVFTDEITVDNDLSLDSNPRVGLGNYIDSSGAVTGTASYNGSIANFRIYSKALNADQVKELYDYQKDYFLGSKSQVTLYKGHLGVGVTEPSGQLELAGDERIQEYPPGPMSGYETMIPGHGVFCASVSGLHQSSDTYAGWKAFNDDADGNSAAWITYDPSYNNGAQTLNKRLSSNTPLGEYIVLELPYKVKIGSAKLHERGGDTDNAPSAGIFYGSNDGVSWTELKSFSGLTYDNAAGVYSDVEINATEYFDKIALVVTNIDDTTSTWMGIGELRYFGTPGPTTLDKGSLTLGRSLDVPRISRYDVDTETPRPEKLVVDFDTTVNSSPTDISGQGNHGTFYGDARYSAVDKAFVFDGNSDYIQGRLGVNGSELNTSYTLSVWVKSDSTANDNAVFMFIGSSDTGDSIGFRHHNNSSTGGTEYRIYHFGLKDTSATGQPSNLNQWRHLVAVYDGTNQNIYVDGVFAGKEAAPNLGLPNNPTYSIGYRWDGGTATEYFDGMISSPKVWSVALEPSEVKKLYNLGRTGRSMVISDTAVGIGKVPEAQLDVRGSMGISGYLGIGVNPGDSFGGALHVASRSGESVVSSSRRYFRYDNNTLQTAAGGARGSIYGRWDIISSAYFISTQGTVAASDERIKKNIIDVNDSSALTTLRLLKPKRYQYRDTVERGTEPVWGFIAQEVRDTLPYATHIRTEFVPNVYQLADVSDSNMITFSEFNTSELEDSKILKVMSSTDEEHEVRITEIIDDTTIRVNANLDGWTGSVDDEGNVVHGNKIFVYGQKVDDFIFVKKDAIWTIATAALQEVDRQLQFERARNDALEARVTALENA